MDKFMKSLQDFWVKTRPFREKTVRILCKIGHVSQVSGRWIYRMRSVLLAIPVAVAAVILAMRNAVNLPAQVGINLQTSGEYALEISRILAVMGPLAVTAVCLLLMFCSRRVIYPWLISLFSLILPVLILITNTFPA